MRGVATGGALAPVERTRPAWIEWALAAEIALLSVGFLIFSRVQDHLGASASLAQGNAEIVQRLEGTWSTDLELALNHWLAGLPTLSEASALFYALVLPLPPTVLAWLWIWRRADYRRLRSSLVALTAVSLVPFALFPVAPPRLHLTGTVDVVEIYHFLGSATTPGESSQNLFAATPSLHVAWTIWCGWALFSTLRTSAPRLRWLAWAIPLITSFDVIATANHYVLDVVAGAALAAAAIAAMAVMVRSGIWTFGQDRHLDEVGHLGPGQDQPGRAGHPGHADGRRDRPWGAKGEDLAVHPDPAAAGGADVAVPVDPRSVGQREGDLIAVAERGQRDPIGAP